MPESVKNGTLNTLVYLFSLLNSSKRQQREKNKCINLQERRERASLVVQWLRICLPMQGTRVRALVREDPTCRGATKPVRHNY